MVETHFGFAAQNHAHLSSSRYKGPIMFELGAKPKFVA